MTVDSAAITGIVFCDESSLVLWDLILYTGQRQNAAHYSQVAMTFRVSGVCVCIYIMLVYIYIYMSIYTAINKII